MLAYKDARPHGASAAIDFLTHSKAQCKVCERWGCPLFIVSEEKEEGATAGLYQILCDRCLQATPPPRLSHALRRRKPEEE